MDAIAPALAGFTLGSGLIMAIGAQNAYVLRLGLLRRHVFAVCLFCALSDALLIVLGIAGLGSLLQGSELLLSAVTYGGAAFLFVYLDTVLLLGGFSAKYPIKGRIAFGLGAVTASFIWFFALGYGARLLAPLFARPGAWQVLDLLIGSVMWTLALSLLLG